MVIEPLKDSNNNWDWSRKRVGNQMRYYRTARIWRKDYVRGERVLQTQSDVGRTTSNVRPIKRLELSLQMGCALSVIGGDQEPEDRGSSEDDREREDHVAQASSTGLRGATSRYAAGVRNYQLTRSPDSSNGVARRDQAGLASQRANRRRGSPPRGAASPSPGASSRRCRRSPRRAGGSPTSSCPTP